MAVLGEKTVYGRELKVKDLPHADYRMLEIELAEGVKAEEEFAKTRKLPDPESTTNLEFQKVLELIKKSIMVDPLRYHKMERLVGVSGETTTTVKGQMRDSGTLPFLVINTNGLFNKIKLDDLNGGRPSLPDGLMGATDVMIAGKVAVGCGYGHFDNNFHVHRFETFPVVEKFPVEKFTYEWVLSDTDSGINVLAEGRLMKLGCATGKSSFVGCATWNPSFIMSLPVVEKFTVEKFTDKWVIPDTDSGINVLAEGRLMKLGCATGHPSFVMSCSFTKQAADINVPVEDFTNLPTTDYTE